jgi:hypothetical protein
MVAEGWGFRLAPPDLILLGEGQAWQVGDTATRLRITEARDAELVAIEGRTVEQVAKLPAPGDVVARVLRGGIARLDLGLKDEVRHAHRPASMAMGAACERSRGMSRSAKAGIRR